LAIKKFTDFDFDQIWHANASVPYALDWVLKKCTENFSKTANNI